MMYVGDREFYDSKVKPVLEKVSLEAKPYETLEKASEEHHTPQCSGMIIHRADRCCDGYTKEALGLCGNCYHIMITDFRTLGESLLDQGARFYLLDEHFYEDELKFLLLKLRPRT